MFHVEQVGRPGLTAAMDTKMKAGRAAAVAALLLAGCSGKPAATPVNTTTLQPAASPGAATAPLQPANAPAAAAPPAGGYSCTFSGPREKPLLAHFAVDGASARDDEGTAFTILANTPTALVLARSRDDAAGPSGDVGAYLVAIDRRDLTMVQSTVGVRAPGVLRKGRCIAG